jgi:hypothetical protein
MGVVWILRNRFDHIEREPSETDHVLADALAGKRSIFCVSRMRYDIESLLQLSEKYRFQVTLIGGQEAYKLADELAKRKIPVILAPLKSSTKTDSEGSTAVWNRAGLLHSAGVQLALSGDDLLTQARFAVRYGLPPEVALRAITTVPAQLLGVADRVGSLVVNHDADMLVLDGDPLEFTTGIQSVIIDGVIYREGELK